MWRRWVERCEATESATTLALFRIAIGLCALYTVGSVVGAGLVEVIWVSAAHGGMLPLDEPPWLVAWLGGATPTVAWGLVTAALVGAAGLTLGVGGRPWALATALVTNNLLDLNGHAGGSYDELLANALWLVFLSGGHRTLSLEAWWRTRQWWPEVSVLAFPRWLAIWQLCLMYGTTGLQKLSTYWVPGGESSALYYILQQPTWQRGDMRWVAHVYPLTQIATTVTWFWEVLAFFWIVTVWYAETPERPGRLRAWSNRWQLRWVFAVIGLVMHAAILITLEVGPFSPLSLAFYVCLAQPAEWERWLGRAR
jgi:hypothetical protein